MTARWIMEAPNIQHALLKIVSLPSGLAGHHNYTEEEEDQGPC